MRVSHHPWEQSWGDANSTGGTPPWRTLSRAKRKPGSATYKGANTRVTFKQGSAFNKVYAKPVTHIKPAREQGSPNINEGTTIKNVTKSGSTSTTKVISPTCKHFIGSNQQWPSSNGTSKTWSVNTQRNLFVIPYYGLKLRLLNPCGCISQSVERC